MIPIECFTLGNGLRVVVNEDASTPLESVCLVYGVGSRNEREELTGFAHLFEHLMFGGSAHVPDFDREMELASGQCNAFTTQDITCYHCQIPPSNLETVFWLESDRMLSLDFKPSILETQRKVVVEEFKQRYLNVPYGDFLHQLLALAYKEHPYRWPTIGLDISHIEKASLANVEEFFFSHYAPNNAVLTLAGPVGVGRIEELSQKWFGDIPRRTIPAPPAAEPLYHGAQRRLELTRPVPYDMLVVAYPMSALLSPEYPVWDLISDVLSNGRSARLKSRLVDAQHLFTDIDAVLMGTVDAGLLVITGYPHPGVSLAQAEVAVMGEVADLQHVTAEELARMQAKYVTTHLFEELDNEERAQQLGFWTLQGDARLWAHQVERRLGVTLSDIKRLAEVGMSPDQGIVIHYIAEGN